VYDYFLTLSSEIERFWKRRCYCGLNWASFLFFANRYLPLLGYIPVTLELFDQIDVDPTVSEPFFISNSFLIIEIVLRGGYLVHLFVSVNY
jgi:hypothetical protein